MRRILALLLTLAVGVAFADYADGLRAFKAGDYATALKEWLPLAERGDAASQNALGTMYWNGTGIQPDYQEAFKWKQRAADQGLRQAQIHIGSFYLKGVAVKGLVVSPDYVQAYKWFTLAGPGVDRTDGEGFWGAASQNLAELSRLITPAQISTAMTQAQEWREHHSALKVNPPRPTRTGAPQTVIGSASVVCSVPHNSWEPSDPIVGAIINQTNTTITDVEVEMSIIARDKKGRLYRQRDTRFVVIPSLNQIGIVTQLAPNGDVYFSIPGSPDQRDSTCPGRDARGDEILNVAAIAITRINGKSLLAPGKDGKPPKQAPLESMLQVPRQTFQHVPTQREVIEAIREQNELLHSTIINKQLQDCLSAGTWACAYNNDTNINVVISQH